MLIMSNDRRWAFSIWDYWRCELSINLFNSIHISTLVRARLSNAAQFTMENPGSKHTLPARGLNTLLDELQIPSEGIRDAKRHENSSQFSILLHSVLRAPCSQSQFMARSLLDANFFVEHRTIRQAGSSAAVWMPVVITVEIGMTYIHLYRAFAWNATRLTRIHHIRYSL